MENENKTLRVDIDLNLIDELIASGSVTPYVSKDGKNSIVTILISPLKNPVSITKGSFKCVNTHAITILGNKNEDGKRSAATYPGTENTAFIGKGYMNIEYKKKNNKNKQHDLRPY